MLYYLNFGFIAEQAIRDIVEHYIDSQRFDRVYQNFHISVVNEHPFAHLVIDDNARASDVFPSIVITSQRDFKTPDFNTMPLQISGIELSADDFEMLKNQGWRNKTKITDDGEKVLDKKERIPGYLLVYDEITLDKLKEIANSKEEKKIYGIKTSTRRRDSISVEVWAENNQLKNEIYEHLRIFFSCFLDKVLNERYSFFDTFVLDNTVSGERSSNYNYDFDVVLSGSHISFDVDYSVSQFIIDTDVKDIKNIYLEVINHVKNEIV